jgi:hypothetical protein
MDTLHVDHGFVATLPESASRVIAASHDSIYVLDRLLTIRAYNSGYARFGRLNGCRRVGEDFGLGCKLISVLPPVAADMYVPAYLRAMETGTRCDHDYECSSPQVFRRYHQTAYPLAGGKGLIVANHPVYETPHTWRAHGTSPRHFDADGWITQCACCRKVRDRAQPEKWDWVPALVEVPHPRTTHGYCLNCLNFHYGDLLRTTTAAT